MSIQNSIRLVGRLTKDPEIRIAESNGESYKIANFSIAVDRYSKNGHKAANYFDIEAFRQKAELIEKYFHKGSRIVLVGEGNFDVYQDKNGNNRKDFKVTMKDCTFGDSKSDGGNNSSTSVSKPAPAPVADESDVPW